MDAPMPMPSRVELDCASVDGGANRRMTEWNASEYYRRSALQKWLAARSLTGIDLSGSERVLDIGCGDGKITAQIAELLPSGSAGGIEPWTAKNDLAPRPLPSHPPKPPFTGGDPPR